MLKNNPSPNNPARLLVSASEFGAAIEISELLSNQKFSELLKVQIVVSENTKEIFQRLPFDLLVCDEPRVTKNQTSAIQSNLRRAKEVIFKYSPDAIFVGLSGLGYGIDEALIACAGNTPTYAFQDFWGDVNNGFGVLPKTYFVIDDYAAEVTKSRTKDARVLIAGTSRHIWHLRNIKREKNIKVRNAQSPKKIIKFYGQPIWDLPGYQKTIFKLGKIIEKLDPNYSLFYRPHPKENQSQTRTYLSELSALGPRFSIEEDLSIQESLVSADLMLTCFSLSSLDLIHLSGIAKTPLCNAVHSMFDPDIRSFYTKSTGLRELPTVKLGYAYSIRQESDAPAIIQKAITKSSQFNTWKLINQSFSNYKNQSEIVLNTILEDLKIIGQR